MLSSVGAWLAFRLTCRFLWLSRTLLTHFGRFTTTNPLRTGRSIPAPHVLCASTLGLVRLERCALAVSMTTHCAILLEPFQRSYTDQQWLKCLDHELVPCLSIIYPVLSGDGVISILGDLIVPFVSLLPSFHHTSAGRPVCDIDMYYNLAPTATHLHSDAAYS